MEQFVGKAGNVQVTDEQKEILQRPIDLSDIAIKPNGIIFAPWWVYAKKMYDAFGLSWALLPDKDHPPRWDEKWQCTRGAFWLYIEGQVMGWAVGEQDKTHSNMGIGEMVEGAKSNALMRVCKGIGISMELWDRTFINEFIAKHCESYPDPKKPNKKLWRLKKTKSKLEQKGTSKKAEPKKSGKKDESYYKYLKKMQELKKDVGDGPYYEILGTYDAVKSSDILDRDKQIDVYKDMFAAAEKIKRLKETFGGPEDVDEG